MPGKALCLQRQKNYVPKLIAAIHIASNPKKYGFSDIAYQEPLSYEVVAVTNTLSLKKIISSAQSFL